MAMTLDDMVPATPGWRLASPESAGSSALSSCLPSSRPVGRSEVVLGCVDWSSCCSSAVSCYGVLFPRHWQSRCENFKPTSSTTQTWCSCSHVQRVPLLDFVRCPGKARFNLLTCVGPSCVKRAMLAAGRSGSDYSQDRPPDHFMLLVRQKQDDQGTFSWAFSRWPIAKLRQTSLACCAAILGGGVKSLINISSLAVLWYVHVFPALRILPPLVRCSLAGIDRSHLHVRCFIHLLRVAGL